LSPCNPALPLYFCCTERTYFSLFPRLTAVKQH
jgi:hypothetical protein